MLTVNALEKMRREVMERIEQYDFDYLSSAYCNNVFKKLLAATRIACERKGVGMHLNKHEACQEFLLFFVNRRYEYEGITTFEEDLKKAKALGVELTEEQLRIARLVMALNMHGSLGTLTIESIRDNPEISEDLKKRILEDPDTNADHIIYNMSNMLHLLDRLQCLNAAAIKLMLVLYMAHERHHSVQDIDFIKRSLIVTGKTLNESTLDVYNGQQHEADANLHGTLAMIDYAIKHFRELF